MTEIQKKIADYFIITFLIVSFIFFIFSLDKQSVKALNSHQGSCSIITCVNDSADLPLIFTF